MDRSKGTILIVDDEPTNIHILAEALHQDYGIKAATSGSEALRIALADPPDLVLLDVMMPDMDGYQVCRELKSAPETRDTVVLFVTALSEEINESLGLQVGAMDYIVKPVNPAIVRARVRNHIELKRQRDVLRDLSQMDGLTGIPNRRRFDAVLDMEWRRSIRSGRPLSVIMLDIDHFKNFNDAYGHMAGDDCLKAVAQALAGVLKRPGDFVARWGGEEFCFILPETDEPGARVVALAALEAVRHLGISHEASPVAKSVTISLGLATRSPSCGTVQALLMKADENLYKAKASGRNCCYDDAGPIRPA